MAEQAFAEYEFTAQSSKTGRTIHELFSGHLVAANGKIKLLRESVNLVEVALGVFPKWARRLQGSGGTQGIVQRDGALFGVE